MSGGGELLGEAVNGVIGPVWGTVWDVLKKQYREGLTKAQLEEERLAVQQARKAAAASYHHNYLERHCNIKVLPSLMKEAMPLDNIYTAVQFLSDAEMKYFSLDRLEELYRSTDRRVLRVGKNERQDGLDVANQQKYLMVLGGPGVGKSTFLRKLGLEALKGSLEHDLIPVFIELKQFKRKEKTIFQAIVDELEVAGFPGAEILANSLLKEGKMLILMDGLDEVPTEYADDVLEQIRNFCDRHSGLHFLSNRGQNRFVVSCRIASYKGGLNRFVDVTMAEFDDDQIRQFIYRWFSSDQDKAVNTASTFWELLQESENASAKELAQTPLLLTFLCLVYDRSQSLPTVRSTLYRDALNILLKDWAAEKRIIKKPIYKGFHVDLEKLLLSEIAYKSFEADQLFFTEQELIEQIATFLSDTLDAPPYLDGSEVLDAISAQQGILVERATNTYSFSHLTLQEFLTARHISQENLTPKIVENHLIDKRWREVFLLVSGLLERQSHSLWSLMERRASKYINTPRLHDLFESLENLVKHSKQSDAMLVRRIWLLDSQLNIVSASANDSNSDSDGFRAIAINNAIIRTKAIAIGRARARASSICKASASAIGRASDIDRAIARTIDIDRASSTASENKRALARIIANAIVRTSGIVSTADYSALATKLKKLGQQMPSSNAKVWQWNEFSNQLFDAYCQAFRLNKDFLQLSAAEADRISQYLYATKLILDCKNSAVRVSKKQWAAIESRLLTPPSDTVPT